jgi:hypothetical protein
VMERSGMKEIWIALLEQCPCRGQGYRIKTVDQKLDPGDVNPELLERRNG